jgi:agmatine deiminase
MIKPSSSLAQMDATPRESGFRMPARFAKHARTLITWPPYQEGLQTDIAGFRNEIRKLAEAISRFEPVTLLVDPKDKFDASAQCGAVAEIFEVPVDACWIRDNGPIFVRDGRGQVAGVHFAFNGWGERVQCPLTEQMPQRIIEHLGLRRFVAPFICEGGGISVDGEGTLITTEQVMLNKNRYAGMDRGEIEAHLHDYLGIDKVIWLPLGLREDLATDGHADNVVEYVAPGVVLVQTVKDRSNPNYELLQDNLKVLMSATDARGRRLEIIEMDVLPYTREIRGQRFAVPYTNAYVVNGAIIAPEVDPTLDDKGFVILERAFPGREIVPVASDWQAVGGGGIGCVTQQVPAE